MTHRPMVHSDLHSELAKRLDLKPKQLLEWKQTFFPLARNLSCDSYHIIETLIQWYKEALNSNVKYWLITVEDWDKKAIDSATKILYPVISDIIVPMLETKSGTPIIIAESQEKTSYLAELEKMCPNWGGHCKSIRFTNTCSIENLIALTHQHYFNTQTKITMK